MGLLQVCDSSPSARRMAWRRSASSQPQSLGQCRKSWRQEETSARGRSLGQYRIFCTMYGTTRHTCTKWHEWQVCQSIVKKGFWCYSGVNADMARFMATVRNGVVPTPALRWSSNGRRSVTPDAMGRARFPQTTFTEHQKRQPPLLVFSRDAWKAEHGWVKHTTHGYAMPGCHRAFSRNGRKQRNDAAHDPTPPLD